MQKICFVTVMLMAFGLAVADDSIKVVVVEEKNHRVRYESGQVVYMEEMMEGRWVGLYWGFQGYYLPHHFISRASAFTLAIKTEPAQETETLLDSGWSYISSEELEKTDRGGHRFVVRLKHEASSVEVAVHTLLDGTSVLTRWLEITNQRDAAIAITRLAPWAGELWEYSNGFTLGYSVRDGGAYEGWFGWTPLKPGENVISNNEGLMYTDPYFVLRHESSGEYFFGQLVWPVMYDMRFDVDDGLQFALEPKARGALRVLSAGESITTPAVHLGYTKAGFNAAVQSMHQHVRRSVLQDRNEQRKYLVQCLMPEDRQGVYRGDKYNEENVIKSMEVAAAAGCEVFIVDGPTWANGYGNWQPKKSWFPNGLDPLREYAHSKGMLFGLYGEIEGGRGDWSACKAFQENPKWFEQGILNLAIPEAAAYMEDEFNKIIVDYQLDMYRHDINHVGGSGSTTTEREGFLESDRWRHYDAFYGITKKISDNYPELILQQASGGGTRLSLATVGSAWYEHFSSDENRHPHLQQMACGLSVFLPPEVIVTPNGMYGPHRGPDLITVLRSAYTLGNTPMLFNMVLPNTMEEYEPENLKLFQRYAGLYKTFIRPLLATIKVYHHAPVHARGDVEAGDWLAMEFIAPDRNKGWASFIKLYESEGDERYFIFKPKGVSLSKTYQVTFDNSQKRVAISGRDLLREGLIIALEKGQFSEVVLFEAQ